MAARDAPSTSFGSGGGSLAELRLSSRPAWVEVDLGALARNYRELARRLEPETKLIASIKANAYGHGAVPVAKTLAAEGTYALATGSVHDAIAVRESGLETPILLLGSHLPEAAADLVRADFIPTVYSLEGAQAISEAARHVVTAFVKVDTGLGRLGVPIDEAEEFVRTVSRLPQIGVGGLYTHLPFSDRAGRDWAVDRLPAFRALARTLADSGLPIEVTQALSSAGAVAGVEASGNAVCAGHILYGVSPFSEDVADVSAFRPVLRAVRARLIHVAAHSQPRSAGLGGRLRIPEGSVTGVVPLGRYDGYRSVADKAVVLVRGRRARVLFVSLEHTTVDLTGIDGARVGDQVTMLGRDGDDRITVIDLAEWQGMTADDVLMNFDSRLPVFFQEAGSA